MSSLIKIRTLQTEDYPGWRTLWDGYNAFYGRSGSTALAEPITASTWARFFSPSEPVHALVAVHESEIVGIVHFVFHRSTTRLNDVCYLQDLFTASEKRGQGIAKRLIQAVYEQAANAACSRVYWQTQANNVMARNVYEQIAQHQGFIVYSHESQKDLKKHTLY